MEPLDYEVMKWRDYSGRLGFVKTEQAEKDYVQELILFELYSSRLGSMLVFRGGTAISKIYGSGRFSEDIDLILNVQADAREIVEEVDGAMRGLNLYYPVNYERKSCRNMLKYYLRVKGPIYMVANNEQAKQTVELDINTYERPLFRTDSLHRVPIYEDIRPYMLTAAGPEELLADKVKAMLERTKPVARDLYDAWVLIKKYRIRPDLAVVDKKMREYGKSADEKFSVRALLRRVRELEKTWKVELSRLMKVTPDYKIVRAEFEAAVR